MYAQGERVTFYPPQNDGDNLHWPAVIEGFTKYRVQIRVFDKPGGSNKTVTEKRIARQAELAVGDAYDRVESDEFNGRGS